MQSAERCWMWVDLTEGLNLAHVGMGIGIVP
jgi:hypothetical protein